jgi:hypothetical protein
MITPIDFPPEFSATRPVSALYARFRDEAALVGLASLPITFGEPQTRVVEVAPEPCEALFERLASEDPSALLRVVNEGKLAPYDLTFAAESLGRLADHESAREALVALLHNPSPVVREGAIYGLAKLPMKAEVHAILVKIASEDSSAAVRGAAADALD